MSVIRNERVKLLANAMDRASTACITVGVVSPIAAWAYDLGTLRTTLPPAWLLLGISGWLLVALILHLVARWALKGLR